MSASVTLPRPGEAIQDQIDSIDRVARPYIVILYNDDHHPADQVVSQLQKATGNDIETCVATMLDAHLNGRSIAFKGSEDEAERVAGVLRQIRLQVETDRA